MLRGRLRRPGPVTVRGSKRCRAKSLRSCRRSPPRRKKPAFISIKSLTTPPSPRTRGIVGCSTASPTRAVLHSPALRLARPRLPGVDGSAESLATRPPQRRVAITWQISWIDQDVFQFLRGGRKGQERIRSDHSRSALVYPHQGQPCATLSVDTANCTCAPSNSFRKNGMLATFSVLASRQSTSRLSRKMIGGRAGRRASVRPTALRRFRTTDRSSGLMPTKFPRPKTCFNRVFLARASNSAADATSASLPLSFANCVIGRNELVSSASKRPRKIWNSRVHI